ncbi:MAG: hypothetical protein H6741_18320 [Alphaproteobacteria bacterium]|nr:hypothetical protein [Alphaproteobacteria bacterium]MCB9794672.1 hypothetical protein [Alphaproteobacteria bacterium]
MSALLDPRLRPWPPTALREAVYDGQILCFMPSETSLAIGRAAWAVVERHLGPAPREAQHRLSLSDFLERLGQARQALDTPALRALLRRWVGEAGLEPARVDRLRLRAVSSGGWRAPGAAPAWARHRDTWYANPPTQLNLWMPLHDVSPVDSLRFMPEAFGRAVDNDSERFVLGDFLARGGFGSTAGVPGVFPQATGPEAEAEGLGLSLPAGALVVFSAAQLHGPPRQETGLTRFSVDLRVVPEGALPGAPDPDNRSQGDASEGYSG